MCFTIEVATPLPTQCNVKNLVKLEAPVFNIAWGWRGGGGGEVRQVLLYSHLACAQKRQKCKFCPKIRPSVFNCTWSGLSTTNITNLGCINTFGDWDLDQDQWSMITGRIMVHQRNRWRTLVTDSSVPLMKYDPSDLRLLIPLIQITPKERTPTGLAL